MQLITTMHLWSERCRRPRNPTPSYIRRLTFSPDGEWVLHQQIISNYDGTKHFVVVLSGTLPNERWIWLVLYVWERFYHHKEKLLMSGFWRQGWRSERIWIVHYDGNKFSALLIHCHCFVFQPTPGDYLEWNLEHSATLLWMFGISAACIDFCMHQCCAVYEEFKVVSVIKM